MTVFTLKAETCELEIHSLAGMIGPAWFKLGHRRVQPFAIAPWANANEEALRQFPALLRNLRGEWPCVPFGIDEERDLPSDWTTAPGQRPSQECWPHGYSANHDWSFDLVEGDFAALSIEYPSDHSVRKLVRTIRLDSRVPRIDLTLTVEMREAAEVPVGLHPTLSLPTMPGSAILSFGKRVNAWTYPVPVERGVSMLVPDQRGADLTALATTEGIADYTRLPWTCDTEELVLVTDPMGVVTLSNTEAGFMTRVEWDERILPACQLWLSNRGRRAPPWNGAFLALGIEPVCAPFDLGDAAARNPANPLERAGTRCSVSIEPSAPLTIEYAISVHELTH